MAKKEVTIESSILKDKIKIILFSIIEALLILMELYMMFNFADKVIPMVGVLVIILLDLFFLINSIIDMNLKNKQLERQNYEDIYKAQKASYLVIRKYFDQLEERLDRLEDNTSLPADEIISAQKAVAKVTISRSKENTDALMNSNDELINHIFGFEEKLSENNKEIMSHQQELIDQTKEDILQKNRELEERFETLHEALEKMQENISDLEIEKEQTIASAIKNPNIEVEEVKPVMEESLVEEESLEDEVTPIASEEVTQDMDDIKNQLDELMKEVENLPETPAEETPAIEKSIEEVPIEESIEEAPVEEIPAMPDLSDPNKVMTPEEIQAMFANSDAIVGDTETAVAEEEAVEEVPVVEEPVEEAPVEEAPAMPDLSDPNKVMTPEEIQAMFANSDAITGGDTIDEAEEAEEPTVEAVEEEAAEEVALETPVEETPAMPDLSDPNRVMSAEEIEALFANL